MHVTINVHRSQSLVFLAAALILVISGCTRSVDESAVSGEKPNIIYILADDAGYGDIGIYGQHHFATPHIDRLAAEGIYFTQHYSGSTVCAPSRSSLMTGLHTGHTYIRGNKGVQPEGQEPLPDSIYTMAEMMQEAGYVTGAFGKWGLGYPGSEGDPRNQGFDRFFGYNCQGLAHNYYPEYLWDDSEKIMLPGNTGDGMGTYSQDVIHAEALRFIEENHGRPFFLFLPYVLPHAELLVPEDSILEKFRGKFPEKPYEGVDYGEPRFRTGGYGSQQIPHAAFAAMMTRLDLYVGQVIEKLDELGLSENTIVMFSSDNGPHLEGGADPRFFDSNGPLRGFKRDVYEGGIRVPFIVRWPGIVAPGQTSDHVSAFWDVMPTLAEIARISAPEGIDGISFLPTLLGQTGQQAHDYLYWEFHEQKGKQAVRKGNWKAVRLNAATDPKAPIELYDLSTDIEERNDVAAEHPEVVREMGEIMRQSHVNSELFPALNHFSETPRP